MSGLRDTVTRLRDDNGRLKAENAELSAKLARMTRDRDLIWDNASEALETYADLAAKVESLGSKCAFGERCLDCGHGCEAMREIREGRRHLDSLGGGR